MEDTLIKETLNNLYLSKCGWKEALFDILGVIIGEFKYDDVSVEDITAICEVLKRMTKLESDPNWIRLSEAEDRISQILGE